MISFPGYEEVIERVVKNGQNHVFEHWGALNDKDRKHLLDDLADIDFKLLASLYSSVDSAAPDDFEPAPYIPIPKNDDEKARYREAVDAGTEYIKKGAAAAFIVAGGQGSRLGFDGPKGMFPIGPVSGKTLFQIHAEKIFAYSKKYNVDIPFLIMTSHQNHDETVAYFEENDFFKLKEESVLIFPQNMIPSMDTKGRIILKDKCTVFKNPDGHGGSLTALHTSGALQEMAGRGIKTISYFQVDNPLVRIIDPAFIGFHIIEGADISSKALEKAYPDEKVGVFVRFSSGRIGVVEYSDLPDEKARLTDDRGKLLYSSGSIAIHLFQTDFVERIHGKSDISLPFHRANKKIQAYRGGSEREIDGLKFEKFVFDALPLTDKNCIFETKREVEFAPVKNATGVDSVETAKELMVSLFRKWLEDKGIEVPVSARIIEISPLYSVESEDLQSGIILPDNEMIILE